MDGREFLRPGMVFHPGWFAPDEQAEILKAIRAATAVAPLFTPVMPRTGKPFSVAMTNLGPLGWVSDRLGGYRYQKTHPETGRPWPALPDMLVKLWRDVSGFPHPPEACLVNYYRPGARMGLHQDRDEAELQAPIVSVSLGDDALFRHGSTMRGGPTQSLRLRSGDVLVFGAEARLCFHGIDRIYDGTSTLLKDGGRINLTLRRVTRPSP